MHLYLNDPIRSELTDWLYSSHFQLQRNLTENIYVPEKFPNLLLWPFQNLNSQRFDEYFDGFSRHNAKIAIHMLEKIREKA